ncbi:hypothetical protein DFH28DRAFT_891046 [Melampsora americana]|nr:hypothetical protein DFH28DRAFT_891046 [Melampsora americana]
MQINIAYVAAGLLVFLSSNFGETDARMIPSTHNAADAHRQHKRQAVGYATGGAAGHGGPNNGNTSQPKEASGTAHDVAVTPSLPITAPVGASSPPYSSPSVVSPISKSPDLASSSPRPYTPRPNTPNESPAPSASGPAIVSPTSQRPVGTVPSMPMGSADSASSPMNGGPAIVSPTSQRPVGTVPSMPMGSADSASSPMNGGQTGGSSQTNYHGDASPIPVTRTSPIQSPGGPAIVSPTSQRPVGIVPSMPMGPADSASSPMNGAQTGGSSQTNYHGNATPIPVTRTSPIQSPGAPFSGSSSSPLSVSNVTPLSGGPRVIPIPFGSNGPLLSGVPPLGMTNGLNHSPSGGDVSPDVRGHSIGFGGPGAQFGAPGIGLPGPGAGINGPIVGIGAPGIGLPGPGAVINGPIVGIGAPDTGVSVAKHVGFGAQVGQAVG